jgi:mitotic spindle assembly checkpoint protein MAD2
MQITASVTFLPLLNDRCSFDLLVYTDAQSAVPMEWWAPAQYFT